MPSFCEGAGGDTYSTEREGRRQTPAEASHVAGSLKTEARLGDLSWCLLRGLSQVLLRHGLEQEAGPGAPRGPEHWGSMD